MKILAKFNPIFDRTIELFAALSAIVLVVMMLLVGADVTMRYLLNSPIGNVAEITGHLMLFITFMGAAWVAKRDGHVKLDIVLNRLNPEAQAVLNTVTSIITAIICLTLAWYGARVAWDFFQRGVFFATILRLPLAPMMAIIFAGYLLLSVQFFRTSYGWAENWRARRSQRQRLKEDA